MHHHKKSNKQSVGKDLYAHIDDTDLLNKYYADRDNKWLGILLQRYTLLLFGVCMKYLRNEDEARDSVQQIILKALTEVQKYKVTFFKSWIYAISRNQCLMMLRQKHGKLPAELSENLVANDYAQFNELLDKDKALTYLEQGINELSEEQKQCVTLFYLNKKSYLQIAASTGFSLLQVKSHIQNGRRNLKIIVEKKLKNNG